MPYAPEYGLDAWTFQLLSRSHSLFTYLNWYFGRQWNRLYIIFHAISRFQPRRWCRRVAGAAWVDSRVPEFAVPATACAVRAAAGLSGMADAPEAVPLLAAMAATASTGALSAMVVRAMVNRVVGVRFSDR